MSRLLRWMVLAAGAGGTLCQGQGLMDQVNFRSATIGGLHLYGVSAYAGYSTSAYPQAAGFATAQSAGLSALGGDGSYGGSMSWGWQRHRERTNLSISYSGGYGGNIRYTELNAFSHSLSLGLGRVFGKWSATLSAGADDSTQAQYLFQPTSLSVISQLPASFDDLAAALNAGRFSNAQAAAMLTGSPVLESPARSLLLGNRILSYSAQAGLGYAPTSRLSFHFGSASAGGQHRRNGSNDIPEQKYVMPRSYSLNASMGVSYGLSPRTSLGAEVSEARQSNALQTAYSTSTSASLSRKMGIHWFLTVGGGMAVSHAVEQISGVPPAVQAIGNASLGYQLQDHTLVASYGRSANDPFGFATGTVTQASGAWNWRRRGSRWGVFASVGQQQVARTGYSSFNGWQVSTGVSERLGPMSLSTQYSYSTSSGQFQGVYSNYNVQSVRVSLGWSPQQAQQR